MPIRKIYDLLKNQYLTYNEKTQQTKLLLQEIEEKNIDINTTLEFEETLLFTAMEYEHLDCANLFIRAGISINSQDVFGNTALIYACRHLAYEHAETLILAGADLDILDNEHASAIFYSLDRGDTKLLELLLQNKASTSIHNFSGHTPLTYTVAHYRINAFNTLIDNNIDLNFTDNNEKSALQYAISRNSSKFVEALINAKANLNERNTEQSTPLIKATRLGYNFIAKQLINAKANVNLTDNLGRDALYYATIDKRTKLMTLLLVAGATVKVQYYFNLKYVLKTLKTHDHRDKNIVIAYKSLLEQQKTYRDAGALTEAQALSLTKLIMKLEKLHKTHKQNIIRALDKGIVLSKREIPKTVLEISAGYDSSPKDKLTNPRFGYFSSTGIHHKLKQEQKLTRKLIVLRPRKVQKLG